MGNILRFNVKRGAYEYKVKTEKYIFYDNVKHNEISSIEINNTLWYPKKLKCKWQF